MKTLTNRILQCAAGLALLSASAFAQDNMTADIPFAFHADKVSFPAGSYRVDADRTHGGTPVIVLRNQRDKTSALALGSPLGTQVGSQRPHLVFRCNEGGCNLRQIWTPDGGYGYPSHPKDRSDDRIALIPLTTSKAD
ncbi:MAG TPA: hypothetical protein VKB79_08060 [Bryobacteraceae bacterium]|nr:hypothetical protein [Bryobacteraceae bacterium]